MGGRPLPLGLGVVWPPPVRWLTTTVRLGDGKFQHIYIHFGPWGWLDHPKGHGVSLATLGLMVIASYPYFYLFIFSSIN